jgi:hypothetical protein
MSYKVKNGKLTSEKAAHLDRRRFFDTMKEMWGADLTKADYDTDTSSFGDGRQTVVAFEIGSRDALTPDKAQRAAQKWRDVVAKHPRACFVLMIPGYDDDPRELWEFPEVTAYVRHFAEAAGIRYVNDVPGSDPEVRGNMAGFLAGCGVFGEDQRRIALRYQKKQAMM